MADEQEEGGEMPSEAEAPAASSATGPSAMGGGYDPAALKQLYDAATKALTITPAEQFQRQMAAFTSPARPDLFGSSFSKSAQAAADTMKEQREAEIGKEALFQKYGMGRLNMAMTQASMPLAMQFNNVASQMLARKYGIAPGAGALPQAQPQSSVQQTGPQFLGAQATNPQASSSATQGGPQPPAQAAPQGASAQQSSAPLGGPSSLGSNGMGFDAGDLLTLGTAATLAGRPQGKALVDAARLSLQYDPDTQTKLAASKNPVSQALYQQQQFTAQGDAYHAGLMNAKIAELTGALRVSANGTRTWMDPLSGVWHSLDPNSGNMTIGNQVLRAPGADAAARSKAAATAGGEAAYKPTTLINPQGQESIAPTDVVLDRSRAALSGRGAPGGAAPQGLPSAAAGVPNTQPMAPAAAPSSAASAAGDPTAGLPVTKLAPQQEDFLKKRGTASAEYLTEMQKSAENARDTNYSLDQMLAAARGASLGPEASVRAFMEKNWAAFAQQFGVDPPKELSSYMEVEKYANKIAFAAARQMGAKEAASVVQMQVQSNPNKSMTKDAFFDITHSMKAMNNYIIDKNAALAQQGANSEGAAAKWTQEIDPRVWALTLSPDMGKKWAETVGKDAISRAYPHMTQEERSALLQNIPTDLRKKWLPTS